MTDLDRISPLLEHFRVRTRLLHHGPLCGVTSFDARSDEGYLHVLRRGEMALTHPDGSGATRRIELTEPTLLFYPRPLAHTFHNAPVDGSDFACARIAFDGGDAHPLVRTLPPVLVVPLRALDSLTGTLDLLFAEVDNVRCGRRLLADRLFEVVLIQLYRWLLDNAADLALPPGLLPGLADRELATCLVAVHEEPGREWTVAAMAEVAAMSRSSFAARFRQTVGVGPAEYVTRWRMTVAQSRLRAGASVAVTARELGYTHPAAFTRAFAQRFGVPPRTWLREQLAAGPIA